MVKHCACYICYIIHIYQRTPQGAHLMVCNSNWHLLGNPKLAWHPARLIRQWGCVDLSMDTMHLKYPLVLFGCEGSALTLPLLLLSPRIIMLCHCSSTMTEDHFLILYYGTKCEMTSACRSAFKHSFIHAISIVSAATYCQKSLVIISVDADHGVLKDRWCCHLLLEESSNFYSERCKMFTHLPSIKRLLVV